MPGDGTDNLRSLFKDGILAKFAFLLVRLSTLRLPTSSVPNHYIRLLVYLLNLGPAYAWMMSPAGLGLGIKYHRVMPRF